MENKSEKIGMRYRKAADSITYGRTAVGGLVAINILSGDRLLPKSFRHRSIGLGVGVAVLGALDKLDGVLARRAEAYGISITKQDKEKDPAEDKKFNRMMMGAIATRELVSGIKNKTPSRLVLSGVIFANLLATEDRDNRMKLSRKNAAKGADTGAIKLNQFKTGMQNLGHTLASSPLAETSLGQAMVGSVYSVSTIMGEIGLKIADKKHKMVQPQDSTHKHIDYSSSFSPGLAIYPNHIHKAKN